MAVNRVVSSHAGGEAETWAGGPESATIAARPEMSSFCLLVSEWKRETCDARLQSGENYRGQLR